MNEHLRMTNPSDYEKKEGSRIEFPFGISYDCKLDKFDGPEDVFEKVLESPLSVVYNTSHECNLRCSYCFRRGSKIPPQNHEEVMSDLKNLPTGKPLRLVLSGGEPFWRKDIYEVLEACAKQPWQIIIVSNGTFPIQWEKVPQNVMFEFSIDAPNAAIYKKMRGGTPSEYSNLIKNVKDAVSAGHQVRPCYLIARVNTSDDILRQIIDFSKGLGVAEIRLQRFKPWGGGAELSENYEFTQEEYVDICSRANDYAKSVGIRIRVPQYNRFLVVGSVYVLPNGDVNIQDKDEANQTVLGNLRKDSLTDIWKPYKERYSKIHLASLIKPKRLLTEL